MSAGASPPDPVGLTRALYAELSNRDFDAFAARFGPTSVWDVSRWGLGAHTGLAAIHRFLQDWFGGFERYEMDVEDARDLGTGVVFAVVAQTAPVAPNDEMLRVRSGAVLVWSGGTLTQLTLYPGIEEARTDAERLAQPGG